MPQKFETRALWLRSDYTSLNSGMHAECTAAMCVCVLVNNAVLFTSVTMVSNT